MSKNKSSCFEFLAKDTKSDGKFAILTKGFQSRVSGGDNCHNDTFYPDTPWRFSSGSPAY